MFNKIDGIQKIHFQSKIPNSIITDSQPVVHVELKSLSKNAPKVTHVVKENYFAIKIVNLNITKRKKKPKKKNWKLKNPKKNRKMKKISL